MAIDSIGNRNQKQTIHTNMISFAGENILVIGGKFRDRFRNGEPCSDAVGAGIASRFADKAGLCGGIARSWIDVTEDNSVQQFFADGTVWSHVVVTGSQVRIAPLRALPLDTAPGLVRVKIYLT